MSKKTDFKQGLVAYGQRAAGSFKTQANRQKHLRDFAEHLYARGFQVPTAKGVKSKHLRDYCDSLKSKGLSVRTIQNRLSSIRAALKVAGKHRLVNELSNNQLGIDGGKRTGSKKAITDDAFQKALERAFKKDVGVAACLLLERYLGLRGEEAVRSFLSLHKWRDDLQAGKPVIVIFGTKGKHPREVVPAIPSKALEAVSFALGVMQKRNGKLIDSPDLASAKNKYSNTCRSVGLIGEFAPHSIRYRFAHDLLQFHLAQGHSERESRALVSMALGHGDGRGRYVASVYLK